MNSAIDFYAIYDGALARAWRCDLNAAGSGRLIGYGNCSIMPATDDAGVIGNPTTEAWQGISAYTYYCLENLLVGTTVADIAAEFTAVFIDSAIPPLASVNRAYVYCQEMNPIGIDAPGADPVFFGSVLAWSQTAAVSQITANVPNRLIPVKVNGIGYHLCACYDPSGT
jgi:hypothetical protein